MSMAFGFDTATDPKSGFKACAKCGKKPIITSSYSLPLLKWAYGAACCGEGQVCESVGALRKWWNANKAKTAVKPKSKTKRRKSK